MAVTKVIRYKTRPESAGLRYVAFRLEDGVSFLHVVEIAGNENPLATSAAFREFQSGIEDRCVEGPTPSDAMVIGNYRLIPDE
jgi:hypothetical protein